MLPPPVNGMMNAPMQWAPQLPMNMQQQQQAHVGMKAASATMSTASAPCQPQQLAQSAQPCWQPTSTASTHTQAHAQPAPSQQMHTQQFHPQQPLHAAELTPATCVKTEQASAQHTCTTGSNSNSDVTWQALDWGMDDMFMDDPSNPLTGKLDLMSNILGGSFDGAADEGFAKHSESMVEQDGAYATPCKAWLDDSSMLDDDFDNSLQYFEGGEFNGEIVGFNKSPSLIDMIDHLCASDPV